VPRMHMTQGKARHMRHLTGSDLVTAHNAGTPTLTTHDAVANLDLHSRLAQERGRGNAVRYNPYNAL